LILMFFVFSLFLSNNNQINFFFSGVSSARC
jgi:hypothetical protein